MHYCNICYTSSPKNSNCCLQCSARVSQLTSLLKQLHTKLESSGYVVSVSCVNWSNSHEVVSNCLGWISKMKELEKEQKERIAYLEEVEEEQKYNMAYFRGVVDEFKQETEADVQLIAAAHDASPIFAHTALLAKISGTIKNMLDLDGCTSKSNQQIPFPELSYEELECLVEFLYSSQLAEEKFEKHIYALARSAHKYEIPFLAKVCERKLLMSLNTQNVLDVLEISKLCSFPRLTEVAVDIVVKNMADFVSSAKYEEFAHLNPDLNLVITKAFVVKKVPK